MKRFSVVVVFLFAVACSSSPSESQGRKFMEDKGAENKMYRVKSFTKTNGVEGDRTYKMEYKAELECLRPGLVDIPDMIIKCQTTGQAGNVEGTLVFEKTESGWRVKF